MPVTPTFPGVYVQETPSDVRTIAGVATAITAFVGKARRGPVNRAERVLNFGEFSKKFGGLYLSSQMSYAVQQFFLNGGNEAWIVRVAKDPAAAHTSLKCATVDVLKVTALYEGSAANGTKVDVDYKTSNPDNTFNLTVTYKPEDNPAQAIVEKFTNLSMSENSSRYVGKVVNAGSELVKIEPTIIPADSDPRKDIKGSITSGVLTDAEGKLIDLSKLPPQTYYQFSISINGLPEMKVKFKPDFAGNDEAGRLAKLCEFIQKTIVDEAHEKPAMKGFTCGFDAIKNVITMTSGEAGPGSCVQVTPGFVDDATLILKLGLGNGGTEATVDAVIRPLVEEKTLNGGTETDFPNEEALKAYFPDDGLLHRSGVYALEVVDLFNILCLPGIQDADILSQAAVYCENRRAFLIADSVGGEEKIL